MIFLIILTQLPAADKTGESGVAGVPIYITFNGLRDEESARNCLVALNRHRRKRLLAIADKGDGEFQIVIEKKRPGYQVRVEKQGTPLKTARALYDYEVCIAAAAMAREAIADE